MSKVHIVYSYYDYEGDDMSSAMIYTSYNDAKQMLEHCNQTRSSTFQHWDITTKDILDAYLTTVD